MEAAAGKKAATSLSLFMETCGLDVEEKRSHFAHPVLGRRSLSGHGKWHRDPREAWMKQIQEVQSWRPARGPA